MTQRLDYIVRKAINGADETIMDALINSLSISERCYVALAANREDWLPDTYDTLAAWHRLDDDWKLGLCHWRDWPEEWVVERENELNMARLSMALDAAGIPVSTLPGAEAIIERLQYLIEERDRLRLVLDGVVGQEEARHD
ncbi:hypothetical protein QT231_13935 [Halomonas sp. SpR1]|uniref:hypothetical protein n=1 Tax=Halomonas sp. SpR1 TaxID=3050462 RepID=UPI0027E59380|nr:hypothetical protein [Halomonas sp. SpR1]MDQ7733809.1 hypothetical protein [Halomonas sp. SpR1]